MTNQLFHVTWLACILVNLTLSGSVWGQVAEGGGPSGGDPFRQLDEILPTPNAYRTASGAPGHRYWQQQVDYAIDVRLEDATQRIVGLERITYTNRSPDTLTYLWLQLDPNLYRPDSDAVLTATAPEMSRVSFEQLQSWLARQTFDGGVNIAAVKDAQDRPLPYTVVKTMMRVDLPEPLAAGTTLEFSVAWDYRINDARLIRGRTGYEYFPDDGNYIYEMAQWFPRLAPYTDANGWQHKQFLGSGEFTLEFGDYLVRITVPADHVVGATGVLLNPAEVLQEAWRERLKQAETSGKPVFIVTPDEARARQSNKADGREDVDFPSRSSA